MLNAKCISISLIESKKKKSEDKDQLIFATLNKYFEYICYYCSISCLLLPLLYIMD